MPVAAVSPCAREQPAGRAAQLAEDRLELFAAVDPLLKAREAVEQQILELTARCCGWPAIMLRRDGS